MLRKKRSEENKDEHEGEGEGDREAKTVRLIGQRERGPAESMIDLDDDDDEKKKEGAECSRESG